MLVAACGIGIAFFGRGESSNAGLSNILVGDLLALAAGGAWGATTIAIRLSVLRSAPASHTLFYQLSVAAVVLFLVSVSTGQTHFEPTSLLLANLAFQAIVVCAISFLVWLWLLNRYVASQLGVFSFLTPLFGVIFGSVILGEPLCPVFIAGALGVLLGILLVSIQPWVQQRALLRRPPEG